MEGYKHFNVLVAGENPDEIIAKYNSNKKVEPYIAFEFKKAGEYKKLYLDTLTEMLSELENNDPGNPETSLIKEEIEDVKVLPDEDYYDELVDGMDIDEKTGDAYSTQNPNGRYISCRPAGFFALPFILKDEDREVYSARKNEINWEKVHFANTYPYEVAWDTVMEGKIPEDDYERNIYNNMKNRVHYFQNFENREHYIASSTAFWCYAFVDENGWNEIDGTEPQFSWVTKFYDRFVKPLPEDTKLTLFECSREK